MSVAFDKRKKSIKDAVKVLGYPIPPLDFAYLRANWSRRLQGKLIGSLQDIMDARVLERHKVRIT